MSARRKARAGHRPFYAALWNAGATEVCAECYAYVLPGHHVHWPTADFRPTTATLDGGLDAQESAT